MHLITLVVDGAFDLGAVTDSIGRDVPSAVFTLHGTPPYRNRDLCWLAIIEDASDGSSGTAKAGQRRIQALLDRSGLEGKVETSSFTDADVRGAFAQEEVNLRGWT